MNFDKKTAKILAFSIALGSVLLLGTNKTKVFATDKVPAGTFDGAKGTITFTKNASYWGVAKKLKSAPKKNQNKFLKINGTDWYQVKNIDNIIGNEVDLGKYKGKELTLAVGSKEDFTDADTTWKIFEVKASNKAFKAYYSFEETKVGQLTTVANDTLGGDYGYLSFFETRDKQLSLDKIKTDLEVKAGAGDWKLAKDYFNIVDSDNDAGKVDKKINDKLKVLVQRGAKLSFRLKGSTVAWGSKETSLSISAQKKGPSVKLDADKELSNLKKDTLYKTILEDEAIPEKLTSAAKGKDNFTDLGIKTTDSAENLTKKQILLVQEPKSKKMASKLTKIYITRQAAPTLKENLSTNGITAQGGEIVANEVEFKLNVNYDVKKGAVIKNKSTTNDYEFFIDYDGNTPPAEIKKWVKLKKAKVAEKPTAVKIAYSESKKNNAFKVNQSKVYLRLQGTKQVNNTITIASAPVNALIKVANIEQVMTIEKEAGEDFALASGGKSDPSFTLKFDKASEKEYVIKAKITNVTKKSGKTKFKVTSETIKGVKVSAEALSPASENESEKDAVFEIKISISDKAFPEDPTGTMKFKVEHESLSKEYTVTFAKKG